MIRIHNAEGTRSALLKDQVQLDIVSNALNYSMEGKISKKGFDAEVLRRLEEKNLLPDFYGPDSKISMRDAAAAIGVLNKIEYSSDGFVKRYPDEDEYKAAVSFLKTKLKV